MDDTLINGLWDEKGKYSTGYKLPHFMAAPHQRRYFKGISAFKGD